MINLPMHKAARMSLLRESDQLASMTKKEIIFTQCTCGNAHHQVFAIFVFIDFVSMSFNFRRHDEPQPIYLK